MSNKQDINVYLEKLKAVQLSESSRSRIQNNLSEYARYHSVRVGADGRSIQQVPQRTSLLNLFKQPKSMTAAIIAIALIAGGGTSYAAEGAVPGDALYVVKTEVNENVKSAFAVGNEAEAKLQVRLAQERLAEAEELAAQGELTAETAADISSRLQAHYDEMEQRTATVEAEGDLETSATVRASLEGSFRSYADILADLNGRVAGNDGALLIGDIRSYANATAAAQTKATATIKTSVDKKAIAEGMVSRADVVVAEAESRLEQIQADVSAEAHARAQARIEEAVSVQAEARAALQTEAYQTAYAKAQKAMQITNAVDVTLDSLIRTQVDMNIGGDSMLNIGVGGEAAGDAQTDTQTRDETSQSEEGANTQSNKESNSDTQVDVGVDARSDTSVDTDVVDTDTNVDASIRSEMNL